MFNVAQQWNRCLDAIKANLPAEQFNVWFAPIVAVDYDQKNNRVTLKVPSQFFVEQIEERYINILSSALKMAFGDDVKLLYKYNVVGGDDASAVEQTEDNSSNKLKQELKIRKPRVATNPFVQDDALDEIDPQLNPRYTFENYCSSMSNKLAVSIGQAIAEHPEVKTYNPMFVFGSTGVGKTHLLQAIGIKLKENYPRMRVLYVSSRVFESQYTTAVIQKKVNDFINFYLSIDVLLLDDIQFLAGKEKTQNTFFHIFSHLHLHQRQLVMSCDCRPSELDGMEPRLLSRFKWGMTVELEKPDFELRRKFLAMKAAQDGLKIADDVLDFIATNVSDSVRELEGVMVALLAHATMLGQDITIDLARSVIGNTVKVTPKQLTFESIAETVADYYNLPTDVLYGKSRKREISDARQLVMYLAKKEAQMSSTSIGAKLDRTHATVLHACIQIEQRMSIEKDFSREVQAITASLTQ
ncbi:MAG: chromosomal replication initiator protein DnaA [Muribaculaceae bacterium]|nr:chromosomal replication initiator protein DnaA [Muribaculaceae bacterium]